MVCCYECGMEFKSRVKKGEIQAYNLVKHEWTKKCPNCSYIFDEDDLFENEYESVDNYESYKISNTKI